MEALTENILLEVASVIKDPVTTTDELIPSGETSSYRSNPERLSRFALSRKDPGYVDRSLKVRETERARLAYLSGGVDANGTLEKAYEGFGDWLRLVRNTQIGSVVCAVKPGDGSAREQAASCQKVLGGFANIAEAYATKRYRSNLINCRLLLNRLKRSTSHAATGYIEGIRALLEGRVNQIKAVIIRTGGEKSETVFTVGDLSDSERDILLSGCLINYYNS